MIIKMLILTFHFHTVPRYQKGQESAQKKEKKLRETLEGGTSLRYF